MEGVRKLVSDLGFPDDPKHEVNLRIFINTAADGSNGWKDKVLALGAVPELLKLLQPRYSALTRMLAVWGLSNLAHEHPTAQQEICQATGMIPAMVALLKDAENDDVVEKVLWLVLNLARHSKNRSLLGTQELIGPLASLLDFDSSAGLAVGEIPARALKWSLRVVVQATRALTNLFYEESAQKLFCEVQQGAALQNVIALLSCASSEIQLRMVNVLVMLSAISEDVRRKLVAKHAINRLMRLLRASPNPQIQLGIAQVLCNLAVDPTAQEVIVDQRAIINIIDLLAESKSRELHTEVVSTLLNASKNVEVRDEICRAGGIPILLDLMESVTPSTVDKKEANFLSELLAICVKLTLLDKHRRNLKSDRSAALLNRLSKANSREVREFANDAINNLSIPVEGEEEEEEEDLVMAIDTRDENEQSSTKRRPPVPTMRPRRGGMATIRETAEEKAEREKLQRTYIKRRQIINEILQTEKIYVKNMGLTVTLFLEPLEKQSVKSVNLSADDVRLLFSSIKTIHALHSTFLVDLELELQSPNHVKLGKMFIELAEWLKMYSTYINNYDNAMQILMRLKEKSSWPIQRVPRYELLLRDVIQSTPLSSPDREDLIRAKDSIEQAAKFLNEAKRKAEAQRQLADIIPSIQKYPDARSLLRPDRELKKQGVVLMATSKKQSAYRYLFLFTDLLLVTKPKRMGKLYNFKRLFNLAVTRFDDVSDSLDLKNAFKLTTPNEKGEDDTAIFYTSLPDEKQNWVALLGECIAAVRQPSPAADKKSTASEASRITGERRASILDMPTSSSLGTVAGGAALLALTNSDPGTKSRSSSSAKSRAGLSGLSDTEGREPQRELAPSSFSSLMSLSSSDQKSPGSAPASLRVRSKSKDPESSSSSRSRSSSRSDDKSERSRDRKERDSKDERDRDRDRERRKSQERDRDRDRDRERDRERRKTPDPDSGRDRARSKEPRDRERRKTPDRDAAKAKGESEAKPKTLRPSSSSSSSQPSSSRSRGASGRTVPDVVVHDDSSPRDRSSSSKSTGKRREDN